MAVEKKVSIDKKSRVTTIVWWKSFVVAICLPSLMIRTNSSNNNMISFAMAQEEEEGECVIGDQGTITRKQRRPDAKVILNGQTIFIEGPDSPFQKEYGAYPPSGAATWSDDNDNEEDDKDFLTPYYILQEKKNVLYVPNFLNSSTTEELKGFCINDGRFQRSPIRGRMSSNGSTATTSVEENEKRTSESCVLVPAAAYLSNSKFQEMLQEDPRPPMITKIVREVDVSMDIAKRASQLLNVPITSVEPLQLVRYTTPEAQYSLHHDHGGYYNNKNTNGLEHRSWTMLIFLNDLMVQGEDDDDGDGDGSNVDVDLGGHTVFPKLQLEVIPRRGDALVWSNVDRSDPNHPIVDPDMVHMGRPPSQYNVEKYAVNVWFGDESYLNRMAGGKWTTN